MPDSRHTSPWQRLLRRLGQSALLLLCSLQLTGVALAQEMALPVTIQWSLFDRILAFDRNFAERCEDELVVAIYYQSRNRSSLNSHDELREVIKDSRARLLNGRSVRLVSIDSEDGKDIVKRLVREQVDVLYITPLRAYDISEIVEISRELDIITLSGVREFIEQGVGVGLGTRGGKPEIVINLQSCKDQGMDLSSEILKLATVLGNKR